MIQEIPLGKLEKLKIESFADAARKTAIGSFEAMFNPESYSLTYKNVYSKRQAINSTGVTGGYAMSKPECISLKLILDGTGVNVYGLTSLMKPVDIYKQVQEFLELTSYMDGDIHEPRHLTLIWGDLTFKGRLSSVQVGYSLFDTGGRPLRAELQTEFFGQIETAERLKQENKNSPDLTHYRVVRAGDQLPLMCKQIYGNTAYYLLVAKANGIKSLRDLKPGQELFFPPIEK